MGSFALGAFLYANAQSSTADRHELDALSLHVPAGNSNWQSDPSKSHLHDVATLDQGCSETSHPFPLDDCTVCIEIRWNYYISKGLIGNLKHCFYIQLRLLILTSWWLVFIFCEFTFRSVSTSHTWTSRCTIRHNPTRSTIVTKTLRAVIIRALAVWN